MDALSVLIVDDSALMRSLIAKIIEATPGLAVADKAMNGRFALEKLARTHPDVIVLDIEMPDMNGIDFLRERKRLGIDIPVVILSSIAKEGARVTMECLELGASDFITKPSGSESADIRSVAAHLVELLSGYGSQYRLKKIAGTAKRLPVELLRAYGAGRQVQAAPEEEAHQTVQIPVETLSAIVQGRARGEAPAKAEARPLVPVRPHGPIEIIAIGISTGGPNALREIFAKLDPELPQPIVVVQHMPAGFTEEFAHSLDRICPLEVKEAVEGDIVKPGRVLIAPGDFHIEVERRPLATVAHLSSAPAQNGHRPSADVLFASVAREFQNRALGIIMTGMGKDGAAKLAELYREGSRTLGQDEASSVVYGMPRVAWELGGVMEQVSLGNMATVINRYGREYSR